MKLKMKPHNQPGTLIVFEGLDGSGKTTQIELLSNFLKMEGFEVHLTKQPTEFVRKTDIFRTYMDKENHTSYDYLALSLLCASDRVQHSNREILPLLQEGKIVIADRYYYSCLANLIAREYKEQKWIYEIAQFVPRPDVSFFLDIDVETAIRRVQNRQNEKNRYIDIDLQYALKSNFLEIAKKNDGIVLETDKNLNLCFEIVKASVKGVMGNV